MRRPDRRGLALLIVVGVLGILAVLATAFTTMAQLERRASAQRLHATKAELLARSGLEDALARLGSSQDPDAVGSRFGGEDWDNSGTLSGFEGAAEVYRTGVLDQDACPVRHALRPSFAARGGVNGNPAVLPVNGRARGFSGRLSGDSYTLGIQTGGIHVNGGDPAAAPTDGYNAVLKRILGTLAEALNREEGAPLSLADGENLVALRPAAGWKSFREIRDVALGGDQAKLDALQPCLALHAWVDRKVIRPNATPDLADRAFQSWADIKLARQAPGLEPRAPVDLAWARSRRPVLIALLAGLKGLWLDETTAENGTGADIVGHLRPAELVLDWTRPTDECRLVADAILQSPDGLRTWQDWDAFCDTLAFTGTTDLQAKRDLLKANFNPNSDLNKFNPNPSLARRVDKSDLLAYSTEFSLVSTGGGRVTSVGRLTDRSGTLLAEREVSAEIAPYRVFRITTQGEFVAGDLGSLDAAGDESRFRAYGSAPYISASQGTGMTFGHRLWGGKGMSLQTAPEPHTVWSGGGGTPALYDGQVQLATVEAADGEGGPLMTFLARWDDGFDADYGGGNLVNVGDPQPPPSTPLWTATSSGTLYPDGVYVEKDRTPGYTATSNMAASRGAISFWLKPGYDVLQLSAFAVGSNDLCRRHIFLNNTRTNGTEYGTACFTLGDTAWGDTSRGFQSPVAFSFHWESHFLSDDTHKEQMRFTPEREIPPHRWILLACYWDMLPPVQPDGDGNLSSLVLVDRGIGAWDQSTASFDVYRDGREISGPAVNFTEQVGAPAVFHLGRLGLTPRQPIGGDGELSSFGASDATFDEFAIYYFGPNNPTNDPLDKAGDMALDRFEAGRYYKEPDGAYFSAPLALGDARILGLSWTQVVPPGLRREDPSRPSLPQDEGKAENSDPGPEGCIVLDLVDGRDLEGDDWVLDVSGRAVDTLFTDPAWSRVARRVDAPFRLHAVFQPNLDTVDNKHLNTAILDPLALDDVTVVYEPVTGPRLLSWESP